MGLLQETLTRRQFLAGAGLITGAVATGCAANAKAQENPQYKVYLPLVIKSGESTPVVTPTPEPVEPPTLTQQNILRWPTWTTFPEVFKVFGDYSDQLQISSPREANDVRVINSNEHIVVGNKGMEVLVDMYAFSQAYPLDRSPGVMVINRTTLPGVWLRVGYDNEKNLQVWYFNESTQQGTHLIDKQHNIKVPTTYLRFETKGFGSTEVFNFYDGNGNVLKAGLQIPTTFFKNNTTKIYFGFFPQTNENDGVRMDVYTFKAKSY